MRPGFWHKCRVGFRRLRIGLWLVVLAGLCALVWFNQIGLPGFLKARLVAALHERGINLEFSRMRFRFTRGLVAENVRVSGAAGIAGPMLMLDEFQMPLDFRSLWRGRVQINALSLSHGNLVWPLSPTNRLQLENIQARLRFQTNDTWSLDRFSADFAGIKLNLSGDISHAFELQTWKIFHGSDATNLAWQSQLQKISDMLNQVHFIGTPELNLAVRGDARDLHSFSLRLNLSAPAVQSPWLEASNIQFNAKLTVPDDAPIDSIAEEGFWRNLQPYQLAWSIRATQLKSEKLDTAEVSASGFWHEPELAVTNLSVGLPGGQLDANAKLNVITRELSFASTSCFDAHALDALLTDKLRKWLAEITWSQPPAWQIEGTLVLPAWTNVQTNWLDKAFSTVVLNGQSSVTNITVRGAIIDTARMVFNYEKGSWNFPDAAVVQGKTHLAMSGHTDDVTRDFDWHISGAVDLESARPFLETSRATRVFEIVKLSEPLALDLKASGRLFDWDSLAADGRLAVTNFTIRSQHFSDVTTRVNYTNRFLTLIQPQVHNGAQTGMADSITLDFNAWLIRFTNILNAIDPEPVVRAIGPKTWKLVEPYHFLSPPTVRVNGQIPLADLHGGSEMAAVDMWFDIIKGTPFEWLKLKTTNIVGTLHWRGQTLLLTNVVAAFYGGMADGFADFDFRVPHPGGDYHFGVNVRDVNLHWLAADLSSPTNSLEGTLAGQLIVTHASTEDFESWRGFGQVNLQNGLLWNIPIIRIVSPVLNTVSPGLGNIRATGASGKFWIANGVMSTDSLEIHSTMTRLEYVGTIDLQQNVNAHVTAHLLRDTWMVGPLVSTALWPVSKIFEYRISGPLQNLKSEPLYVLPKLLLFPLHPIRSLENIFTPGSDSYTNRPSGNRN